MIDDEVRRVVYETAMRSGRIPLAEEIASELSADRGEVAEALGRLSDAHILVLQPNRDEILMAMPFSAVPTPFVVESRGMRAYANCMWDALGIPAMLHADATIATSCHDCGTAATLIVADGQVRSAGRIAGATQNHDGFVHFALPLRQWWNNVVFT